MKFLTIILIVLMVVGCSRVNTVIIQSDTETDLGVTSTVMVDNKSDSIVKPIDIHSWEMKAAGIRFDTVYNRFNVSDIKVDSIKIIKNGENIEQDNISAMYYSNCVYIDYQSNDNDIGLMVDGEDCYLLDNKNKIAYQTKTENCNYINSFDLFNIYSKGDCIYLGTGVQEIDSIDLLCDFYYVDKSIYKMCYDNDNLIATIVVNGDKTIYNIFKTLTIVTDMTKFEVNDYIKIDYGEYLSIIDSDKNKFMLLLKDMDNVSK